ncbi:MAG TPA: 3-isopropylmalate dehydratase small subunit [Egibacteraceae bacterium]|nr:3-isopropylmalate dehydratase small subunit [Egibacteraceae bacterium]
MEPVQVINGRMVPLDRADIDTDQIMPKQFLKRIERTGFGEFLFHDWRQDPGFILNDARYQGANVLVTGPNFGSGSSREHAPWGLQQYGFDAIVAPSFADIFKGNCAKIGLLTVELPAKVCKELVEEATEHPGGLIRIDLPAQQLTTDRVDASFAIDPFAKHLLMEGLDDIGLTLRHAEEISEFEASRPPYMPVTSSP